MPDLAGHPLVVGLLVLVIGQGVGIVAAALRLAHRLGGLEVAVLAFGRRLERLEDRRPWPVPFTHPESADAA